MPEDQLFSFDSAEFQPGDILRKLVDLLKRNPKATFTIEGYTDSIGTDEYNVDLSQRRADNMKFYLVQALGIDPSHIDARGRGSTKFVVPPRPVAPNASQAEFDAEIQRESQTAALKSRSTRIRSDRRLSSGHGGSVIRRYQFLIHWV